MALDVQRISLDISKQPTPQQVRLGQGDANATRLIIDVFDDGIAYSLSGYSVRLEMRLPESDSYYSTNGTSSGNTATFDIDETYAATSYGFDGFGYVDILSGITVICSTSRFQLVVLRNAQDGADPSTAYSNGIIEATERANEAAEAAEGVVLQAVPTMSSNVKGGAKLGSGLAVSNDTLSATNVLQSTNIDRDEADPASDTAGNSAIVLTDKDGEYLGRIDTLRRSDGRQDLRLLAYNENNGTQVDNSIHIRIAKDGTRGYYVADQAAFRTAIGISSSTTYITTASSIITASSECTITGAYYAERNGMAQLRVTFKTTSTASSGNLQIGTVIAGKRPAMYVFGTANSARILFANLSTAGALVVYLNQQLAANTDYGVFVTYLLP